MILLLGSAAVLGLLYAGGRFPERRGLLWTAAGLICLPTMLGWATLFSGPCFWEQFWMRWNVGLTPDFPPGLFWLPIPVVAVLGLAAFGHRLWVPGGLFFGAFLLYCFWIWSLRNAPDACPEPPALARLAAVRSALSAYRQDHGTFPASLTELTAGGKYMKSFPRVRVYGHERQDRPVEYPWITPRDTGAMAYINDPRDKDFGAVFIDCTHVHKDRPWSAY